MAITYKSCFQRQLRTRKAGRSLSFSIPNKFPVLFIRPTFRGDKSFQGFMYIGPRGPFSFVAQYQTCKPERSPSGAASPSILCKMLPSCTSPCKSERCLPSGTARLDPAQDFWLCDDRTSWVDPPGAEVLEVSCHTHTEASEFCRSQNPVTRGSPTNRVPSSSCVILADEVCPA